MLHKSTEVRVVNPTIGRGIYATEPIPKGTVIMFEDPLDIKVTPKDYSLMHSKFREILEFFAYVNLDGDVVFSWDDARYMNHSCDANTLPTGHMVIIAIRDIAKGEEITTDYGLLDVCFKESERTHSECMCTASNCRKEIHIADPNIYSSKWGLLISTAYACAKDVKQPLVEFMNPEAKKALLSSWSLGKNNNPVQLMKDLIENRQVNFYKKWKKILAEEG